MKKDRNSLTEEKDHALPRSRILRGRQNFKRLFGRSSVLKSPAIHFRYRLYDDPSEGCLIGFIAKKRLGKAVTRNRIKRLLREVYRTHQHLLLDLFTEKAFGFHGAFIAQRADITYQDAVSEMVPLLVKIRSTLLEQSERVKLTDTRIKREK